MRKSMPAGDLQMGGKWHAFKLRLASPQGCTCTAATHLAVMECGVLSVTSVLFVLQAGPCAFVSRSLSRSCLAEA